MMHARLSSSQKMQHLIDVNNSTTSSAVESTRTVPTTINSRFLHSVLLILGILLCSFFNPYYLLIHFYYCNHSSEKTTSVILTTTKTKESVIRALYVVASMAEYQTGAKGTVEGEDRFANTFVPIVSNAAHSIVNKYPTWDLDVFLIVGYTLRPERYDFLRKKLPEGVGLQLWEDAIPLSYNTTKGNKRQLQRNYHSLNRQHRFVLRDKLNYYDLFIVGEDDMAIHAAHVEQYLDIQTEINRLKEEALVREQHHPTQIISNSKEGSFYGNLTSAQLSQMMPGFLRVEVYPTGSSKPQKNSTTAKNNSSNNSTIFSREQKKMHVDPVLCCHLPSSRKDPFHRLPHKPKSDQLVLWETSIEALGVRHFPKSSHLDWVVYLPGVVDTDKGTKKHTTDSYWSGTSGILGLKPNRPDPHNILKFAHQAMYIMTRQQILALDQEHTCKGRFLPPFSDKYVTRNGLYYNEDAGIYMNSAEFMVGGLQLYTNGAEKAAKNAGCNMQRIVSLANFSKHLTYHVSNNKQRTINVARHVLADDLLRQLNYVKDKAALLEKSEVMEQRIIITGNVSGNPPPTEAQTAAKASVVEQKETKGGIIVKPPQWPHRFFLRKINMRH